MKVLKRNGKQEDIKFDKITERLKKLSTHLNVTPHIVSQKVLSSVRDGISTSEIDEISADVCVSMMSEVPDYEILATRILVSNLQKNCPKTFSSAMNQLGLPYKNGLNKLIQHKRDFDFDYFGIKTLMKMYLMRDRQGKIIETPQYMFMRVAMTVSHDDSTIEETYEALSTKMYIHASPTLFNAGSNCQQMSSCFVAGTLVFTVNRGPVPIEQVQIGDIVVTHLGNHKKVLQTHENHLNNRQLYSVKVYKTPKVEVTGNHRFWSITKEQLELGENPQWNSIENLRVGDWIRKHYDENRLVKNQRSNTMVEIDGNIFLRINEKMKITKENIDYVYTLGIQDDHSYTVNGLVAENCFLVAMKDDSISGIYDTKKECALISKYAGGIGMHIHDIRSKGSHIRGTNGKSDGIIPMLRSLNADARYINQGGRRKGSYAIYLEPWHADIFEFLEIRLNSGDEEARCRDLFTALWVPDLFMKRLEQNGTWSLFCPNEAPGLSDVYGDEFEALFTHYENRGLARVTVPIQKIWLAILKSQVETGTPYILYKDKCNMKSNQKNIGTIKSSNLCVAPETWVKTRSGREPIMLLEDKTVDVWNGNEWSTVTVKKTSNGTHLMDVECLINSSERRVISCTPDHQFILEDGTRISAKDLKTGSQLLKWTDEQGTDFNTRVTLVSNNNRFSRTYCFTEPIRNQGVFNGILTGQCAEIIEYSDAENTAVCNLASMALPSFVENKEFNFEKFEKIVNLAVRNLNTVIDKNFYPVETAEVSNFKTRPIALGVQGLADVFAMIGIPFDSMEARELNKKIFEHMYFAALYSSCQLAQKHGTYDSFNTSPAADGILQFDMWGVTPTDPRWNSLKENIKLHGLRNSLLIGLMPTASTSQILGFNECFEPFTTNIYLRRTLAGEFMVLNKYLVKDLCDLGLWTREIKDDIIRNNGSIQSVSGIPQRLKGLYKTVWETGPRVIMDMSRDRGAYVCQSQSMNLFVEDPTNSKLSSIHMYAWKQGLKTGMYYLRTRPKTKAQQVTIEPCIMCSG